MIVLANTITVDVEYVDVTSFASTTKSLKVKCFVGDASPLSGSFAASLLSKLVHELPTGFRKLRRGYEESTVAGKYVADAKGVLVLFLVQPQDVGGVVRGESDSTAIRRRARKHENDPKRSSNRVEFETEILEKLRLA